MKGYAEPSIPSLFNKLFDLNHFNELVDITSFKLQLSNETENNDNSEISQLISEKSCKIIISLEKLLNVLEKMDEVGKKANFDIDWVFGGRFELSTIFDTLELLDNNVEFLLMKFEKNPNLKTDSTLDYFNSICDLSLSVKKITHTYHKRLSIANHYNEIEKGVIASVNAELTYCIGKLEELDERRSLLNIENKIRELENFDSIKSLQKDVNPTGTNFNGLIIFSNTDAQIFESYTTLHDTILPISQSIKLIPYALDDFFNNSRMHYMDLVVENIKKYERITKLYDEYRRNLKAFKKLYIYHRINLICEKIFQLIESNGENTVETLEEVMNILRPIDNAYGLAETYSLKLKRLDEEYNFIKQKENVPQTPISKGRINGRTKRVFSNPLVDSLNMQPILSDMIPKTNSNIKIFQTPRHIDDNIYSKDNIEIMEKIKIEVNKLNKDSEERQIEETPSSIYSSGSSNSSPDVMRTRNIFDSPDPFITPNSRSFQKSRLPISTPATTPRITPTKKYVMLPIDREPAQTENKLTKNITFQPPLLRYELSTLVETGDMSDKEINISPVSRDLEDLSGTPDNLFSVERLNKNSPKSPPISGSRIPLPMRPESRLDMIRSASRLQRDNTRFEKTPARLARPDSRLENIASSISTKLGTNSPVLASQRPRSTTVMTQREMRPTIRPIQLGRLKEMNSNDLRNLKVRGATSLGMRGLISSSRISSV